MAGRARTLGHGAFALDADDRLCGVGIERPGVIHYVEAGENLYRIGLRYGVEPPRISRVNGVRDVPDLRWGPRLFLPGARRRMTAKQQGVALTHPPMQPM